jgi:hypothetical protein
MTAMIVMKMLPPFPSASAYTNTKGWGASSAKSVSRSGMQKRKRIEARKPSTPVAKALVKIPFPTTTLERFKGCCKKGRFKRNYLAFFVSSAMWPEASKPVKVPAVKRPLNFRLAMDFQNDTHKHKIQFQPGGAIV